MADALTAWYLAAYDVCKMWASQPVTSLDELARALPPAPETPHLDLDAFTAVVSQDCDWDNGAIVQEFRTEVNKFLQLALPNSPLLMPSETPWHSKVYRKHSILCVTILTL
eukprot:m.112844 g.112844  ORF g.112844 m.112844 type:complete len:111 (-) comp14105_c0_seq12:690-1022(-)